MTTMTPKTLWELPVPSTSLLGVGPVFEKRAGREIALRMSYETTTNETEIAVCFVGVEAIKITYHRARNDDMLMAYDRLVDVGATPWLGELSRNLGLQGSKDAELVHLMINFDDGPCYEVICNSYRLDGVL